MAGQQPIVLLELTVDDDGATVSVAVANRSGADVVVVTLERYLQLELEDERGQFVGGQQAVTGAAFPSKADYRVIPKNSVVGGRVSPRDLRRGRWDHHLRKGPAGNGRFGVTYKAEPIMPGLPSKYRSSFYRGPHGAEDHRHPAVRFSGRERGARAHRRSGGRGRRSRCLLRGG